MPKADLTHVTLRAFGRFFPRAARRHIRHYEANRRAGWTLPYSSDQYDIDIETSELKLEFQTQSTVGMCFTMAFEIPPDDPEPVPYRQRVWVQMTIDFVLVFSRALTLPELVALVRTDSEASNQLRTDNMRALMVEVALDLFTFMT